MFYTAWKMHLSAKDCVYISGFWLLRATGALPQHSAGGEVSHTLCAHPNFTLWLRYSAAVLLSPHPPAIYAAGDPDSGSDSSACDREVQAASRLTLTLNDRPAMGRGLNKVRVYFAGIFFITTKLYSSVPLCHTACNVACARESKSRIFS